MKLAACSTDTNLQGWFTTVSTATHPTAAFIRLSLRSSIHLLSPSVRPSIFPFICSSARKCQPYVRPSVCPYIHSFVCVSFHASIHPTIDSSGASVVPFVPLSESVHRIQTFFYPSPHSSVLPTIHSTISPSARPFVRLIHPSVYPFIWPSFYFSVRPCVPSSIRPSVSPSIRPSVRPSGSPSVRPCFLPR